ncbi:MAG: hypothetical protein L3K15_08445, partial [Thermoplasmata archaeon]|nr:hypothetical protein [Thermoplasmata archaeon]
MNVPTAGDERMAIRVVSGRPVVGALFLAIVTVLGSSTTVSFGRAAPSTVAASPLDLGSGTPVGFGLNLSSGTGFGIDFQFGTRIALTGGNLSPGATVQAAASWSIPNSTTVRIEYLHTTTTVTIDPVGTLVDYAIPGLNLQYLGVPLTVSL